MLSIGAKYHYMLVIGSWLVYELALLASSIYFGGSFYSIGILSVMLVYDAVPNYHVWLTGRSRILY